MTAGTSSTPRTTSDLTMGELMVCAAAREIRAHEVVFVGMRLPLIAFVVAKKTHAPSGGPSAIITTQCVLRFAEDGEAYLASVHPGVAGDDVLANTGWNLHVAADVSEPLAPTEVELNAVREYDKEGFWTK
jgi:acyl CoA:acetate/3-ketoacid CoA transferase beta subunit